MAVDKTEGAAAQVEVPKGGTKKTKKSSDSKKMSSMERFIADNKAQYKDLDTSEGRKMRKRTAAATAAMPKKAKKAPAKKSAAVKKAPAKKGAAGKSSEDAKKE